MKKPIKISDLPDFDMAEHLRTDAAVANYLTLALAENDSGEQSSLPVFIAREGIRATPKDLSALLFEASRA